MLITQYYVYRYSRVHKLITINILLKNTHFIVVFRGLKNKNINKIT